MILMDKVYGGEDISGIEEDVCDACWSEVGKTIPLDEYNFQTGTFRVVITWEPDDDA